MFAGYEGWLERDKRCAESRRRHLISLETRHRDHARELAVALERAHREAEDHLVLRPATPNMLVINERVVQTVLQREPPSTWIRSMAMTLHAASSSFSKVQSRLRCAPPSPRPATPS
jgi:hypothetical protein